VQRCERLELMDLAAHVVVDEHGLAEARAAVDDAVRDRFDVLLQRVDLVRLVALDDVQLQARGARVDYEYGQTQSRTSGWSSPYSRVQAR
jgi:hypothetical protein